MPDLFRFLRKGGVAALLVGWPLAGWGTEVTMTQRCPIEQLDADGRPSAVAMAVVGARYEVVRQEGGNLVVADGKGGQFRVEVDGTDYVAPAVTAPATNLPGPAVAAVAATNGPAGGATNAAVVVPSVPATTPSASTAATNAVTETTVAPPAGAETNGSAASSPAPARAADVSADDAEKIKALNAAFGLPLFFEASFWDEGVETVARRLGWPKESETSRETSYRRYAEREQATILGAPAYSMALYGKSGKPVYVSIIFANAGDFAEARKLNGEEDNPDAVAKVKKDLAVVVKRDAETIAAALTGLLGEPAVTLYGNASSNREEVHRWDFKDAAILLDAHEGEYLSIKIIPAESADHHGLVEVTDRDAMRDLLAARVLKRENGDVILSDMPMVDQGPKGYCVPATWERYLRYMDLPADLYVLAIMGHTGMGGGTNLQEMEEGVDDYVSAYHRRIETYDAPLDIAHVAKYIDQGLPLMWSCWVDKPVEIQASEHSRERRTVTDWGQYAAKLKADDAALGQVEGPNDDRSNGHMRLIIGYNAATEELAISDSWGVAFAERWMYVGTAVKISQGRLGYLSW